MVRRTARRGSEWETPVSAGVSFVCNPQEEIMAEPRPEKVAEVEALEQRLRASSVVILTDYRGLTVSEIGTSLPSLHSRAVS